MNRIKSTFKRHSSIKDSSLEHRRSDAFIKKLEESKRFHQQANDNLTSPPTLDKSDLSKHELNAYQSWWKDLDPFGVGKADNQAVFQFVSGCGLSSATLEKILSLYQDQKDGLTREEFFAILRLIAHAQHGRTVNRDIVYLGAPLPSFQTQAIDALIKRSLPEAVKSCDDRLTVPTALSSQASPVSPMLPTLDRTVSLNNNVSNTLLDTPTITSIQLHSRSKSVPFNFQFTTATVNQPFDNKSVSEMKSRSRHSSLDSDSLQKTLDTGKSLLLTQSFKPSFSLDDDGDDDDTNSNRNSSSSSNSSNYNKNNPYLVNPFETDESSAPTPRLEITITPPMILPQSPPPEKNNSFCYHLTNSFYNSEHIPPPPVPPQSTKPAYPKYARRTRV